jgi:hypothetical protein
MVWVTMKSELRADFTSFLAAKHLGPAFSVPPGREEAGEGGWSMKFSCLFHSPAPTILQRLSFSSAYHSPATTMPATAILQHLPFPSLPILQ